MIHNILLKVKISPLKYALGILGALGLCFGFPNNLCQFPVLVLAWPLALFCLGLFAKTIRVAFLEGWLCSLCGMLFVMYWLAIPVHKVGQLPWPAAASCAVLICAALALQGGLFAAGAFLSRKMRPFSCILFLAFLWYLLELVFALIFGFPWLPLSAALSGWILLVQGAEFLGAYALGGLWVFILLGLVTVFPIWEGEVFKNFPKEKLGLFILSICLFIALLVHGYREINDGMIEDSASPAAFEVVMVEGNIDQNIKWVPEFQKNSLDLYIRLTREALLSQKDNENLLVIWPETALPFFYETSAPLRTRLDDFVVEMERPLLFGAPGIEKNRDGEAEIYNRAFLLNKDGRVIGTYDKEHLVPFGEYAPKWLKFDFLEALLQGVGVYSEGNSAEPLRLNRLALGMLICYEGIFPWLAQARVEAGANVLVDISNDGWFGNSPAATQHLNLSILRCIEQKRWLVRATNTGISAIADDHGRIRLRGPQFRAGFLSGYAEIAFDHSFYYKYGYLFPWIALLVSSCLLLPLFIRTRQN